MDVCLVLSRHNHHSSTYSPVRLGGEKWWKTTTHGPIRCRWKWNLIMSILLESKLRRNGRWNRRNLLFVIYWMEADDDGEEKVPSSSTFSPPLFLSPDEKMCDGVKWKIGVAYYVIIISSRSRKIEIVLLLRHETDVEMKFTLKSSLFALAHHAHKCQIPLKVKTRRGKRDFIKFRPRHFGGFFSADWRRGGGGEWRVALRLTVGNDDDDDNRSGVPFLSTRSS